MNFKPKRNNRLIGLKAKRTGAEWEDILSHSAHMCGCKVIQIPSGCKWVGNGRAVPVTTPFVFVIMKGGKSIFVDAKSCGDTNFTHSKIDQDQVFWLSECAKGGNKAGYIVRFSKQKKVVFFSVERLASIRSGESLKPEDGYQLPSDLDRIDLRGLFYEQREETASSAS